MIEILKSLISIESISGSEELICTEVMDLLSNTNGHVERIGNSIMWRSPNRKGKKHIALGAHLDTVPFTASDWTITSPTVPLEKDGKIYGRGSCDMKGGAAIILDILLNNSYSEEVTLSVFFYDKEELGMPNGVGDLMDLGYFDDVDLCIIPEPTECKVNYGVLGNLDAKFISSGIAVHSSKPKSGRNALYELLPVIEKIKNHPCKSIMGIEEAISVNKISGGNAINILPDQVEAWLDYRFDPDLNEEQINELLSSFESEHVRYEILGIYPGIYNRPDQNPLIEKLVNMTEDGGIVPFWTDIGQLGTRAIPAVNFGPGSINMAHRKDEYVPIDDLFYVRDVLIEFLNKI